MFRIYLLLTVFIITVTSCSSGKYFNSYWNPVSSKENFKTTEAIYYHSSDKLSLKVFNNNEFIDIILETNSPFTLQKIYNLGLSIWIDPDGKSKNIYAVNYPMPVDIPFTNNKFRSYLKRFSTIEFQEELIDRFQDYEIVDRQINENILLSTTNINEEVRVYLNTNKQVLFSCRIHIPLKNLYLEKTPTNPILSIGIASINEANQEYYSALSSKEYIQKRVDELKAGAYESKFELEEWWTNFRLQSEK